MLLYKVCDAVRHAVHVDALVAAALYGKFVLYIKPENVTGLWVERLQVVFEPASNTDRVPLPHVKL